MNLVKALEALGLVGWTASDYAAWWGAIIATVSLGWNMLRALKAGARIEVRATPNMVVLPESPETQGRHFISATAVNRGTASTTITHFCGFQAKGWWAYVRRKRLGFTVNAGREFGLPLPHVLAPGEQWINLIDQAELDRKEGEYLRVGVIHNQREFPVLVGVPFPRPSPEGA